MYGLSRDNICTEATFRDLINDVWLLKSGSFNFSVNHTPHFKQFLVDTAHNVEIHFDSVDQIFMFH